jgi:hypothetical protein
MGHSSMQAALIYQHAPSDRVREIALGIDARLAMGRDLARERPGEHRAEAAADEEASGHGYELRWRCEAGDGGSNRTVSLEDHVGSDFSRGLAVLAAWAVVPRGLRYPSNHPCNGTPMARRSW